jgi:hypothetical protein
MSGVLIPRFSYLFAFKSDPETVRPGSKAKQ